MHMQIYGKKEHQKTLAIIPQLKLFEWHEMTILGEVKPFQALPLRIPFAATDHEKGISQKAPPKKMLLLELKHDMIVIVIVSFR